MKIKNVYASKDNIKKVKRQPTAWKKIFICKSDIRLALESRTYTTQCEEDILLKK